MTENATIFSRQQSLSDKIQRIFDSKEQKNQCFIDKEPITRNILLLGRRKSGKTTLVKMIENPTRVCEELTLVSSQVSIDIRSLSNSKLGLLMKIVDTVGFIDSDDVGERFQTIRQHCINYDVTEIHLICLCVSITEGIRKQDIQCINSIKKHFPESIEHNLCMIMTRCESKMEGTRKGLYEGLKNDTLFKSVINLFEQGIYFSGALNYDDWNQGNDCLEGQFENIYNYREKLLDLIKGDIRPLDFSLRRTCSTDSPCPPFRPLEAGVNGNSYTEHQVDDRYVTYA
ncbi:unnamed protein product [Rotaria socialis]|uniref:AIG1-type G domain-containing protein n=1 Tax=Rotaria socialis TaxID=392032 RepID=A0A818U947_9BILA|nr:unnamed protein product [Rotaria socialis]CAF4845252.1 unnamed protein product [Rotaria socialis]